MQLRRYALVLVLVLPLLGSSACLGILDVGSNSSSSPNEPDEGGTGAFGASIELTRYCAARRSFGARCSSAFNACEKGETEACEETFSIRRPEYLAAITKCDLPATCDAWRKDQQNECLADEIDKITPTPLQLDLARSLCAGCSDLSAMACLEDFFFHGRRSATGAVTVSGSGSSYDMYSEAVVMKIRDACLAPAVDARRNGSTCWPTFYACVDEQVESLRPASVVAACAAQVPNAPTDPVVVAPTDSGTD